MNKQTEKELLRIVENNYDKIAKEFNETRKKELWQELNQIAKSIHNKSKIIDVGCGNGRLIDSFHDKEVEYLGIDQSSELIKIAIANYSEFKNVKFSLGKIQELYRIKEIGFDYVFCIALLHHIPSTNLQVEALKQLKNKVNKQGKIIISVWNLWRIPKYKKLIYKFALLKLLRKNQMDFGDILFDWKDKQGANISQRYYHAFTERGLRKIAKLAGLKIEKIYKDTYNYYMILSW